MRCKICSKTFRTPPPRMRETQICSECTKFQFPTRKDVKEGSLVMIEKKRDRGTEILTKGTVEKILTPGNYHPEGLMVDLMDGVRGRVKKLLVDEQGIEKISINLSSPENTNKNYSRGNKDWISEKLKSTNSKDWMEAAKWIKDEDGKSKLYDSEIIQPKNEPDLIEKGHKVENSLEDFRIKQIENHDKLIQINKEIDELKNQEQRLQNHIKEIETRRQKKNEGMFPRFRDRFSKKNEESLKDLDKLLSEISKEFERIEFELSEKISEHQICRVKETVFLKELEQLEKIQKQEEDEGQSNNQKITKHGAEKVIWIDDTSHKYPKYIPIFSGSIYSEKNISWGINPDDTNISLSITGIELDLGKVGNPTGTFYYEFFTSSGTKTKTYSRDAESLAHTNTKVSLSLSEPILLTGEEYLKLVFFGGDPDNYINLNTRYVGAYEIRENEISKLHYTSEEENINENNVPPDETKSKSGSKEQSGICKGICKNFKAKKPTVGGRYDSGQGRCQICEIYIDYKGAHMKDGSPATEDSAGWFCNCCNYRVRQNPRNKEHKEKLKERIKEKEAKKRKKKITPIEQAAKIKAELDILKEKAKILNAQQPKPKKYMKKADERPPKDVKTIRKTKEQKLSGLEKPLEKNQALGTIENSNDLFLSSVQVRLIKKFSAYFPEIYEAENYTRDLDYFKDNLSLREVYQIISNWEEVEDFYKLATCYFEPNKISLIVMFEKTKDRLGRIPKPRDFEKYHSYEGNVIMEFESWENFLELLKYDFLQEEIEEKIENEPVRVNTNKINDWITDALILIRSRRNGILQSEIQKLLSISNRDVEILIPRLIRIEGIFEENVIRDGIVVNRILKLNRMEEDSSKKLTEEKRLRDEIKEIENKVPKTYERLEKQNQIKNSNQFKEQSKSDIENLCMEVIRYKRKKIEQDFLKKVISEYIELGSIKKVCEKNPWEKEERIRRHLPIPKRFPKALQEKAHHLISDPESSMTIVMYATDYFGWDGNINDESKVVDLAIKIQKGFNGNNTLRLMLSGKRVG